ncbi:MAG TPA: histidinol-phosphate transaminase [Chitinispirillaceae bacterium]|nr:histidinol-phosphate transaminase [Chitinispirillaceae bacterium]
MGILSPYCLYSRSPILSPLTGEGWGRGQKKIIHWRKKITTNNSSENASFQIHGSIPYQDLRRLGIKAGDILDFSATVNPYPLPQKIIECFSGEQIAGYPDSQCYDVIQALHGYYRIPEDCFTVNVGTSEVIYNFPHLFKRPVQFGPTYGDYRFAFTRCGREIMTIDYPADRESLNRAIDTIKKADADLVIICSPNNPDGKLIHHADIEMLCQKLPKAVICIDESYQEMSDTCETFIPRIPEFSNILVLKSFTKPFGLGGLRTGYAAGSSEIVRSIKQCSLPWGISTLAQRIIPLLFDELEYFRNQWNLILENRNRLCTEFERSGLKVKKSVCPFFLLNVGNSEQVRQELLMKHRIAVRSCSSFGYPELLRIMPGEEEKNRVLLRAIEER